MKLSVTTLAAVTGVAAGVLALGGGVLLLGAQDSGADKAPTVSISRSQPHSYSKDLTTPRPTSSVQLGEQVPEIAFTDLNGQQQSLSAWRGRPVAFIFADTSCPCVKAYEKRVRTLAEKFETAQLRVVYVFSKTTETPRQVRDYVAAQALPWISTYDNDQKLMRLFNAQCTTEAFLVDGAGKLRYHGRIDDSTYSAEQVRERDLEGALTAVLANRAVAKAETKAYGCTLDSAAAPAAKSAETTPNKA